MVKWLSAQKQFLAEKKLVAKNMSDEFELDAVEFFTDDTYDHVHLFKRTKAQIASQYKAKKWTTRSEAAIKAYNHNTKIELRNKKKEEKEEMKKTRLSQ